MFLYLSTVLFHVISMLRPFLVRGRGRRSLRAVARCSCPKMKCYMPSMPLSCGVRTAGDITGPKLVMLVRLGETNEWYIGIVHIMYYMDMYFELWKKTWGSYRYHMALYRTMWWNCLLFPHFFVSYYIWPKFNTTPWGICLLPTTKHWMFTG